MRKPLPKSEKKVRVWSDVTLELKDRSQAKADAETKGNLSAFIRLLLENNT